MTAAHSKSYQSIKVEHPDDDAGSLISRDVVVRPEPSRFKTKGLVFVTALCAAVLVGVVSFSRTDEFAYANNSPSGMSLNVDEAFLFIPEEDEDFLDSPISELSVLPGDKKCFSPAGVPVGPAGHVYIKPLSAFAGLSFERKGNNCDCSYAQTECRVDDPIFGRGKKCSDLIIDGRDAALNGYPDVTLSYTLKLCNYNDNDVIKLLSPPSTTQFFFPVAGGPKFFISDQSYNGQSLRPGECKEVVGKFRATTSRAKHFMKAQLQGPQTSEFSGSQNGFCFAFSFNRVDFKYDYGPGFGLSCDKFSTKLTCTVTDGTGRSCEDVIKSRRSLQSCDNFLGLFEAELCNNNGRDIQIQKKASNFKVSINNPDPKGKPVRKEPIGDEIADGKCIKKSFLKKVNPCEKNFWSIGLQGSIFNPNAENGFVFKDKDCRTFKRSDLPVIDLPVIDPPDPPSPCPSKGKGKDNPSKGKGKDNCKKNPSKKRVLYNTNNHGKRGEKRSGV